MKAAWYEKQGAARDVLTVGEMDATQPLAGEVWISSWSHIEPTRQTMLQSCRAGAATKNKANEPMSIAVEIQLNEQQQAALERVARRRKVSLHRVLKSAVDDFIERLEEEELLESSERQAQRKPWQEKDAVELVRAWRRRNYPEKA